MTVLKAVLVGLLAPLAVTIVLETGVAVLFGLRRRGLIAVAWINLVTNPSLNVILLLLAYAGLGFAKAQPDGGRGGTVEVAPTFWGWFILCVLEVIVMIVEWRVLVRLLGGNRFSSRKLLVLSVVMNLVSAVLGSFVLTYLPS